MPVLVVFIVKLNVPLNYFSFLTTRHTRGGFCACAGGLSVSMSRDKREKVVGGGGGERRVFGQQFLARALYSSLSAAPVRDRDFVA